MQRYYGTCAKESLTADEIRSFESDRSPGLDLSTVYNCSGGAFSYFAYPASRGLPNDVRVGGFRFTDFSVSTVSVNGVPYSVLRFNNLQHTDMMPVEWR